MTDKIIISRKEIDKLLTQLNITHQDIRALLDKAEVVSCEPICNLWVCPATLYYKVDRGEHHNSELIPVYTSPQPQLEVSEPVGEIKIYWGSDTGYEYGLTLIGGALGSQKEYNEWIVKNFNGEGVFKLYTTPQPSRVAELEAEIARLKAIT